MVEPQVEKGYEMKRASTCCSPRKSSTKLSRKPRTAWKFSSSPARQVDPVYFDASYNIAPEEAGQRAYQLLTEAMEKSGYAGIAKIAMHNREYIVIITSREHGLTLHTMFYSNEIRAEADYGQPDKGQIKEQERTLAQQLIESLAAPFEPDKYHDTYQAGLQDLIEAKSSGRKITAMPHGPAKAPVIDLMEALKKSLAKKPAAVAEKKLSVVRAAKAERKQGRKTGKFSSVSNKQYEPFQSRDRVEFHCESPSSQKVRNPYAERFARFELKNPTQHNIEASPKLVMGVDIASSSRTSSALRESVFCSNDFTPYPPIQALRIISAEEIIRTKANDGKMSSNHPSLSRRFKWNTKTLWNYLSTN